MRATAHALPAADRDRCAGDAVGDGEHAATMTANAAAPEPPINDNYLGSLNLNKPGTPLNRKDTLSDARNTAAATVQSDIFSPHPTAARQS